MTILTPGDLNVVANIRYRYGEQVASYTDLQIATTWRHFSQSDEYPDDGQNFLDWLEIESQS